MQKILKDLIMTYIYFFTSIIIFSFNKKYKNQNYYN